MIGSSVNYPLEVQYSSTSENAAPSMQTRGFLDGKTRTMGPLRGSGARPAASEVGKALTLPLPSWATSRRLRWSNIEGLSLAPFNPATVLSNAKRAQVDSRVLRVKVSRGLCGPREPISFIGSIG